MAGMLGSASILIEKEHCRFELAMFAMPRGVESALNIMVDHGASAGTFRVAYFFYRHGCDHGCI